MIKGILNGWLFIIQLIFHITFPEESLRTELEKIHQFIVKEFNLKPVMYLEDMACKY
jgi:hypothetical protein